MNITFPIFFVIVVYVFVLPQFKIPLVNAEWIGLMVAMICIIPLAPLFMQIKNSIIDFKKEEMELSEEDLIKVFASKSTLIMIGLWLVMTTGLICLEMSTADRGFTIRGVYYSADKIALTVIIFVLFMFIEETRQTYFRAVRRIKEVPKKKKKS